MSILNFLNMTMLSMISGLKIELMWEQFKANLKYMGYGMLCIFIVIGVIILFVYALNKITSSIEAKKNKKESNSDN